MNFILSDQVKGKNDISIISRTPVTVAQAYAAFLSALEANGMSLVPAGAYWKVVERKDAAKTTLPLYDIGKDGVLQKITPKEGRAGEFPNSDAHVTLLYEVKYANKDQVQQLIRNLMTKNADLQAPGGSLLILSGLCVGLASGLRKDEEGDARVPGQPGVVERRGGHALVPTAEVLGLERRDGFVTRVVDGAPVADLGWKQGPEHLLGLHLVQAGDEHALGRPMAGMPVAGIESALPIAFVLEFVRVVQVEDHEVRVVREAVLEDELAAPRAESGDPEVDALGGDPAGGEESGEFLRVGFLEAGAARDGVADDHDPEHARGLRAAEGLRAETTAARAE